MMIRPAVVDDADAMARVVVDAWKWAYGGFMPKEFIEPRCDYGLRAERMRARWQANGRNWVAEDDSGRAVGFACEQIPPQLSDYDSEIGALYVHPSAARAGVGRALVKTLAAEFLSHGCRTMAIHTLQQNTIGCAFYERIGGMRGPTDEWNGFAGIWFVWADLGRLAQ